MTRVGWWGARGRGRGGGGKEGRREEGRRERQRGKGERPGPKCKRKKRKSRDIPVPPSSLPALFPPSPCLGQVEGAIDQHTELCLLPPSSPLLPPQPCLRSSSNSPSPQVDHTPLSSSDLPHLTPGQTRPHARARPSSLRVSHRLISRATHSSSSLCSQARNMPMARARPQARPSRMP